MNKVSMATRASLTLVVLAGLSALVGCVGAAAARAAAFGELGQVGVFGASLQQFTWPSGLAADPTDNSVYVLDEPGAAKPGPGPSSFRVQKFNSSLGAPVASVSIPTPEETTGHHPRSIFGMAVDGKLHRLYVLEGIQTSGNNYTASEILAYSTQQAGGTLPLAEHVPSGVFYTFPAAKATNALERPRGIAVDPTTDDLIAIGGEDEGAEITVIQRIHASGPEFATGSVSKSFPDLANPETEEKILSAEESYAHGVTVGADGNIYLVDHNLPNVPSHRGVVKLSSDFTSAVVLREEPTGPLALTGGADPGPSMVFGPQISAAPEAGGLVYAAQQQTAENATVEPRVPGSYEIRGMSAVDGSQQIVFGGGTAPHCLIASSANAIAAGSGGVVYALDEGGSESTGVGHSSFGFDLVKFGPDGSGCPSPSAAFKVNASAGSEKVVVKKGEKVVYEADSAGLNGEKPTELVWDLDGSGKYETKATGSPPSLKEEDEYLKPDVYTIGLKVLLEHNGNYGNPPPVTRQIEVVAAPPQASFEATMSSPKPEESVTFNGELSTDPTGVCSAGHGCGPTNHLKEYIWEFGDGKTETKLWPEDTYSRKFANASTQSRQESVTLTVVNEEGTHSAPVTQTLTIQGTPGSGGGSTTPTPTTTTITPAIVPPPPAVTVPPVKKPLTMAQKLARALRVCAKIKSKKKRAACVAQAKRKYGPKKKRKKKSRLGWFISQFSDIAINNTV